MEYSIFRSRRRSLAVSVGKSGIVVRSPIGMPNSLIDKFLLENMEWIEKQKRKVADEEKMVSEEGLYTRKLPYLGCMVDFVVSNNRKREVVWFSGERFEIFTDDKSPENVSRLYSKWLKREAVKVFADSVSKYSKLVGTMPSSISIRGQKTRWGSASASGKISLNYNLLKTPREVLDYVVVHELCHLKVRNHSKRFWDLVKSVVPEYNERRKWLRKNRYLVMERV